MKSIKEIHTKHLHLPHWPSANQEALLCQWMDIHNTIKKKKPVNDISRFEVVQRFQTRLFKIAWIEDMNTIHVYKAKLWCIPNHELDTIWCISIIINRSICLLQRKSSDYSSMNAIFPLVILVKFGKMKIISLCLRIEAIARMIAKGSSCSLNLLRIIEFDTN